MIQVFKELDRLFVLLFENKDDIKLHTKYYLPTVEIKDQCYDWWTDFFDQPVKNNLRTYHNTQKIAIGQGED